MKQPKVLNIVRTLKNDTARIAFLEDYRNKDNGWELWIHIPSIERQLFRLQLTDDVAFVVEEQLRTYSYPNVHRKWSVVHWYIVEREDKPFGDYVASRSQALARMKEEAKK